MKQRLKKFIQKHKVGIALTGGTVIGFTVGVMIYKSNKGIEMPKWVYKWERHCVINNLLFENGLPIYADKEQTKIYRDAIVESAIPEFIEMGFEIIEREA